MIIALEAVVGQVLDAVHSAYPPSFDNNPLVFAWALFSRFLVATLSFATLVRINSLNGSQRVSVNHPVFYHRTTIACFLWGALLASTGDVATYLLWNELSNTLTALVLLTARLLDALTIIPFVMGLFVPVWLGWMMRAGVVSAKPRVAIADWVNDARSLWTSPAVPLWLLFSSALLSAGVTAGKYVLWLQHERF